MGMDISFLRIPALQAGLIVERRWDHDISREVELLRVPQMIREDGPFYVENDGTDGRIIVRANEWGPTYVPLTQWLIKNAINWETY